MKEFLILTQYSVQEAVRRKVFIAFTIITLVGLMIFAVVCQFFDMDKAAAQNTAMNPEESFRFLISAFELQVVANISGIGLMLSVFAGASLLSGVYEKGTIDLFLSKPVARYQYLLSRYFGGLIVVLVNIILLVVGAWLIVGLSYNYWNTKIFFSILSITYTFAVLNALTGMISITLRSSVIGMMAAYFVFIILSPMLAHREAINQFFHKAVLKFILEFLYIIIPQTSELLDYTVQYMKEGAIQQFKPLILSALLLVFNLALMISTFEKKDL